MERNQDNQPKPSQSVTVRRIDNLVSSSSPLFYIVSGSQSDKKQSPKYYEQLGCPSILKPSFRDLPGCTRLSVGVPSTSKRQFPILLDNLSKSIMGKSSNMHSKRYVREEKFISPIKVNAKIRHIYSHISASSSSALSQKSAIVTTSTQTDFEIVTNQSNSTTEVLSSFIQTTDASTCMSPPPPPSVIPFEDCLFSIPSSHTGKLEDLEKITGHIVIRRFFTRADEAFGSWLENTLLNSSNKPQDSGTADNTARSRNTGILENILEIDGDEGTCVTEEIKKCDKEDLLQCECFLEYYYAKSAEILEPILTNTNDLSLIDKELISQCAEYEIYSRPEDGLLLSSEQENTQQDLFTNDLNQEGRNETTTELNDIEELHKNDKNDPLEKADSQIHESIVDADNKFKTENQNTLEEGESFCEQASISLLENTKSHNTTHPNGVEIASSPQPLLSEDLKEESVKGSVELVQQNDFERTCIPDVIDVSAIPTSSMVFTEYGNLLTSELTNQVESQYKVAEYLGKLENEPNDSIVVLPEEYDLPKMESSMDDLPIQKSTQENHLENPQSLKRSISNDSCIGTESSGEARFALNDSGMELASSRTQIEEEEIENPNDRHDGTEKEWEESQSSIIEGQEQKVITSIDDSRKRFEDDNNSRSDQSSVNKRLSDGEDADQSESDSDINCSVRSPQSVMSVVSEEHPVEEDAFSVNDEDQSNEPDKFDFMIASHEKLKRVRPVCRKRNISTQTSKSIESSVVSTTASSRSTTASSDSTFDLEFVSKSKKYISSGDNSSINAKRKSCISKSSSSLNVLNMKFTLGREFESQVSIRIPQQSPNIATSSSKISNSHQFSNLEGGIPISIRKVAELDTAKAGSTTRSSRTLEQSRELTNLWKDVQSKMESRVGESSLISPSINPNELHVQGSRMKLVGASNEILALPSGDTITNNSSGASVPQLSTFNNEGQIKRSLKRLQKILDDSG